MRVFLLMLICAGLSACAKPQIVEQVFSPDQTLHMSRIAEVTDKTTIGEYVFYLNEGDTIPLKLNTETSLATFEEPLVHLLLKRKVFFRIDMAEDVSEQEIERAIELTPEQLAAMEQEEVLALAERFKIYLSLDGSTWALLTDPRAVKEILGLDGGTFSLGMAFSSEEGVWFLFSLQVFDSK